eukprot:UN05892
MSTKREKDRASATGLPIKSIPAKEGAGRGNWGSDQEQISRAIDQHTIENGNPETDKTNNTEDTNASRRRKRGKKDEPDSFAALNPANENREKQTWDDYVKKKKKNKTAVYNKNTAQSNYKKKYKSNKYEAETDILFAGSS